MASASVILVGLGISVRSPNVLKGVIFREDTVINQVNACVIIIGTEHSVMSHLVMFPVAQ